MMATGTVLIFVPVPWVVLTILCAIGVVFPVIALAMLNRWHKLVKKGGVSDQRA